MRNSAGDPPAFTFLMGYDSTPIRAEKSLYDLAQWIRGNARLTACLSSTPSRQIATQLESEQPPDGVDAEDWHSLRARLDAHLQQYGYIIYDLDFAKPLPADDPMLRRMLRELGARLARAGALDQGDDIFWLTAGQVEGAIAALERGASPVNQAQVIRARQAEWQAQKRLTPPPMLPPAKKYMGINTETFLAADAAGQGGDTLKGVGASAGRVTAPASVLHGPQDFDQMKPGRVLVAAITTPAWTPLFAMASAIVTDVGGPLSHGSIVAREYGIPAVLGTGVATKRIQSGQVITVDGSAGIVTLSKNDRVS